MVVTKRAEAHIGRPVLMSEHEDTDGYGSYFTDEQNGDPFWTATYYSPSA